MGYAPDRDPGAESGTPKLYTVRDAAALLAMGESTLRREIRFGRIRSIRVGPKLGCVRVPEGAIREYLAGREERRPSLYAAKDHLA